MAVAIPSPVEIDAIRAVMAALEAAYPDDRTFRRGRNPYRTLVSMVISQRTREEQTSAVSRRVFARYPDAQALAGAEEPELFNLLDGSQYRELKAPRLIEIARLLRDRHGGEVPNDLPALLALPGVGRKTANCVLIYAFDRPALCVDAHLHRITNRLGWVRTPTPDQTERALERVMPRDLWAGSNRLFLQHGRARCGWGVPRCHDCPVREWCAYGQDPQQPKR